jgi:hypothetical protein
MTLADDRLRALFADDAPPARDAAFSAAVMARLARRRCVADMACLAGLSALGGLALWGLWPVLQPALVTLSARFAPVAAALAVGASVLWVLRALPGQAQVAES